MKKTKLTNNHIKLFPIKKEKTLTEHWGIRKEEESWDDIINEYERLSDEKESNGIRLNVHWCTFRQYLKENYNPPIKK